MIITGVVIGRVTGWKILIWQVDHGIVLMSVKIATGNLNIWCYDGLKEGNKQKFICGRCKYVLEHLSIAKQDTSCD